MLTQKTVLGKIEILENGEIQVRTDTIIYDNDKEMARTYHRKVLYPGDDIPEDTDERVVAVAQVIWTPKIIKTYKDKVAQGVANAEQGF